MPGRRRFETVFRIGTMVSSGRSGRCRLQKRSIKIEWPNQSCLNWQPIARIDRDGSAGQLCRKPECHLAILASNSDLQTIGKFRQTASSDKQVQTASSARSKKRTRQAPRLVHNKKLWSQFCFFPNKLFCQGNEAKPLFIKVG